MVAQIIRTWNGLSLLRKLLSLFVGMIVIAFGIWTLAPLFYDREVNEAFPAPVAQPAGQPAAAASSALASGAFVDGVVGHRAEGRATVYALPENMRSLRLDDFNVTNGPDLFVLLSSNANPKDQGIGEGYLQIQALKGNQGSQNYDLGADIDLNAFKSVVIWCRSFNVVFGYAPLEMADPMSNQAMTDDPAMASDNQTMTDDPAMASDDQAMIDDQAMASDDGMTTMATQEADDTMMAAQDTASDAAMMAQSAPAADTAEPMGEAIAAATVIPTIEEAPAATVTPIPTVVPAGPVALQMGSFIDGLLPGHKAKGTATIYQLEDGARTLRLEDFVATNGPDLFVILSPNANPKNDGVGENYLQLEALKGNQGNQNYELAGDVDLGAYKSVVIWCRAFNVIFGYATLEAAE